MQGTQVKLGALKYIPSDLYSYMVHNFINFMLNLIKICIMRIVKLLVTQHACYY